MAARDLPTTSLSARHFAWFRVALGLYLALRFLALIPYAGEVFGRGGAVPDPALNLSAGVLPNPLARWDQPWQVQAFLALLVGLALLLAAGVARRSAALALAYGAACLFDRNNLISNPSLAYVGALLLLSATIPRGEPLSLEPAPREPWFCPRWALIAAWVLLAAGYTFSGLDKLTTSPSWRSGDALRFVLELPLARPSGLNQLLLGLPEPCLRLLTWGALAVEVTCLPLCLRRETRPWAWLAATLLQLGILITIGFAELTLGMLLVHAFVYDPAWGRALGAWLSRRARPRPRSRRPARPQRPPPLTRRERSRLAPGS